MTPGLHRCSGQEEDKRHPQKPSKKSLFFWGKKHLRTWLMVVVSVFFGIFVVARF